MSSGPTADAARSATHPTPRQARRAPPAFRAQAAWLLVVCLLASTAAAREPVRAQGSKDQYRQVVAAWTAGNPDGVVALMPARGTLRLTLFTPQVAGSYQRRQAKHFLKGYFEYLSGIHLKDVTDKNQRLPRGWAVRTYEYRYVPRGRDPVKALLTITMKGDGRGTWTLDSIRESARR